MTMPDEPLKVIQAELKPCPSCGQSGPAKVYIEDRLPDGSEAIGRSVRCVCGMQTARLVGDDAAIRVWNTRLSHLPQGEVSTTARFEALDPDALHEIIAAELDRLGPCFMAVRNAALKITELVGTALSTLPQGEGEVREALQEARSRVFAALREADVSEDLFAAIAATTYEQIAALSHPVSSGDEA